MPRFRASQLRSQLSRAQSQLRHSQSKLNQLAREADRTVSKLNSEIRTYNTKQRMNQQRLNQALRQLDSRPIVTTRYVTYRTSVHNVHQSFIHLQSAAGSGVWADDRNLLDLAEGETAASAETLSELFAERDAEATDDELGLKDATISNELTDFGRDLDARWRGALFALSPRNPDAARHFCTSARELLIDLVDHCATDAEVLAADPSALLTDQGSVSRRARIYHRVSLLGDASSELSEFVEADVDDVIALMKDANDGTHGPSGRFNSAQLQTLKSRVERAIRFLHRVMF